MGKRRLFYYEASVYWTRITYQQKFCLKLLRITLKLTMNKKQECQEIFLKI